MEVTSLAENLYFTTVRIDTVDEDGIAGSGTGFYCVALRAHARNPRYHGGRPPQVKPFCLDHDSPSVVE